MTGSARDAEAVLAEIQAALDTDGVWVAPSLRERVDGADVAAISDQLAAMEVPTYFVLHDLQDSDPFGGDPAELLTRLHDRSDKDGFYLAPQFYGGPERFLVQSRSWGSENRDHHAIAVADHRHEDDDGLVADTGAYFVELAGLLADPTAAKEAYEAEVVPTFDSPGTSSTSGSPYADDGNEALVGAGVGALLALLAVVVWWRRRARRGRVLQLPASVVANVRAARDSALERRADVDVLALGEAIDEAEIDPVRHDAAAWQQALDHHEGAQRVLRRPERDVLDVVGAIVLAERGRRALAAATAGKPFVPAARCYLHPLHEGRIHRSVVESGGRQVEVPVCSACRAALKAGRTPDVLDVERRGRPVHYFETDAEPWASTGYGALHPDLIGRLHTR